MSCTTCGVEGTSCCPPAANPVACQGAGLYCSGKGCVSLQSTGGWKDACNGPKDTTTCDTAYPGLACVSYSGGITDNYPFGYWCNCGPESGERACAPNKICGGTYIPTPAQPSSSGPSDSTCEAQIAPKDYSKIMESCSQDAIGLCYDPDNPSNKVQCLSPSSAKTCPDGFDRCTPLT